ncbi:hypothetical protein Cgig2_012284 [Carnegiea gigantea]|uniref:Serine carboxypeptidase S28 family protein n=1 Tax=Carnegiea gigantea TaxID=171969 RepID=A0A9Q1JRD5_9CARY|nr:hypothetical protein Cgig2_012284 [Carnegiea gigantea]
MPRLGRLGRRIHIENEMTKPSSLSNNTNMTISHYSQTLDHFNYRPESYLTFKQKYIIYSKHWGGAKANSPILVYLGDEAPLYDDAINSMILSDYAARLKALLVLIEHRFYGESKPFGMTSMEEVLRNASVRGYFNSAQAIADYAELILHLKKSFKAHYSPVIVSGGSYGGSKSIHDPNFSLLFETSESCYNTIKKSWAVIDKIGSKPNGLSLLSKKFKTCKHLSNTWKLKDFLDLRYCDLAQYGSPSWICDAMDKAGKGADVLTRVHAGVAAVYPETSYCLDISYSESGSETDLGWAWQTCSEMVMPIVHGTSHDSMFPPGKFDLDSFIQDCKHKYNVLPRPHWITTYYGGHDIKLILQRFGSNIIFSNGLKDPYSTAGVLEYLSDSIVAVYTKNGSSHHHCIVGTHCQDLSGPEEDDP